MVAVAARDPARAEKFARKHKIPKVHATYDDVIADPDVEAIYNPLPNALHAEWTLKAIEAGKHVLCEKPFTSNAAEAEEVAAADGSGLVVMEAFHYRYHPLAQRMHDVVAGGELGTLERVETTMCIPLPMFKDIRYRYDLAGGATMDVGSYTVHQLRLLGGGALRSSVRMLVSGHRRSIAGCKPTCGGRKDTRSHDVRVVVEHAAEAVDPGVGRARRAARLQPDRPAVLPPVHRDP